MSELANQLFRAARLQDESLKRRALVLNILFLATFGILMLSAAAICIVYFSGFNHLVLHRLWAVTLALIVVGALYFALRRRRYFVAASGLLIIYWLLATVMAITWGVALPGVLLLYCALIVLSGIVLGATYAIFTLCTNILALLIIQLATVRGNLHPNMYWQTQPPHLDDLVVYYFVFSIVGVSSWLFNRQTDTSLHHALRAEAALQREKDLLELKVERRTRELQAAQLDKMQQMYQFAQLGQFSTSLLHDIGNHMTTLSLDVEGMSEQQGSNVQRRIKQRIDYIDKMVQLAYDHINGKDQARQFNVAQQVREITKILQHDARLARVRLHEPARLETPLKLYGDPTRFRQVIANLVTNAIDAYPKTSDANMDSRNVWVRVAPGSGNSVVITVQDNGSGIPADVQQKIFDPFYSTKHSGTGIGLFIVKQVAQEHFGGSVTLASKPGETTFTVTLHAAQPTNQ